MRVNHTLKPFYDKDSEILILGTMPSVKSRELGFYYMHPQNRFWKLLADVFEEEFPQSIADKKQFLKKHKIALWDVLKSCDIKGSSDSSIKNPIPNDINTILSTTKIKNLYVTGKKAENLYNKYLLPKANIKCMYLPSPSTANAAVSYSQLLEAYQKIKQNMKKTI